MCITQSNTKIYYLKKLLKNYQIYYCFFKKPLMGRTEKYKSKILGDWIRKATMFFTFYFCHCWTATELDFYTVGYLSLDIIFIKQQVIYCTMTIYCTFTTLHFRFITQIYSNIQTILLFYWTLNRTEVVWYSLLWIRAIWFILDARFCGHVQKQRRKSEQHYSHNSLRILCTSGRIKSYIHYSWHVKAKTFSVLLVSKFNRKMFSDFMHSNIKHTDKLSFIGSPVNGSTQ